MSAAEKIERGAEPLEPYRIKVPDGLVKRFDDAVERVARRLDADTDEVRRLVEVAVLQRGLASFEAEEGNR